MGRTSTNWGKRATHLKKEWVLIDMKPNLNNTDDCQRKANMVLANIKRVGLSLEIKYL